MSSRQYLGPWIALAGAFVGGGLYFGLRHPAPTSVSATPTPVVAAPANPSSAPPPPPPPPGEVKARVQAQVAAALEERRADYVERCWKPALARQPEPAATRYELQIGINAEGEEILRSILELRGQSRTDVAVCLRGLNDRIRIPPPHVNVDVTVALSFP